MKLKLSGFIGLVAVQFLVCSAGVSNITWAMTGSAKDFSGQPQKVVGSLSSAVSKAGACEQEKAPAVVLAKDTGATVGEIERVENSSRDLGSRISTLDTLYTIEVAEDNLLPAGSALLTSSGALEATGITAIIHAASGSNDPSRDRIADSPFKPTLKSVAASVKNSLILAHKNGHKRVAVPFIGGKIFAPRIGVELNDLANAVIQSTLVNARELALEIRFTTHSDEDTGLFQRIVGEKLETTFSDLRGAVEVVQGDITVFSKHGASAIVNAANIEVVFGGGISGAIARSTRNVRAIDAEAAALVTTFNSILKSKF